MKNVFGLAGLLCALSFPLFGQEPVRDALRDLSYEEDDRVLAHLLALLPQARDAVQFEAAVDHWIADLDPADTVNVRHRIDELLRETPERDLYGLLIAVVRHRSSTKSGEALMGVSASSNNPPPRHPQTGESSPCRAGEFYRAGLCCPGGSIHSSTCRDPYARRRRPTRTKPKNTVAPPPYPQQTIQELSALGGQLANSTNDCSAMSSILDSIWAVTFESSCSYHNPDPCASLQSQLGNAGRQLMQSAGC